MRYSFFKGCFIPVRLPHLEAVARRVFPDLGVELEETDDFSCCPEPLGFTVNDKFSGTVIAARNISIAEDSGNDIITLCNGCTYVLKQVNHALKENQDLRDRVNEVLATTDHQFRGEIEVKHFVSVLKNDLGLDKIKKFTVKPLRGLSVASHTGCHIISPLEIMNFDDPYEPKVLDELVQTIGAEPLDFDFKTLCCGWTLANYGDRDSANRLLSDKLRSMKDSSADCVTAICPQCFYQFDTGQMIATRRMKLEFKIPVMFYLQLLALAMDYSLEEVHYRNHRIKNPVFEKKIKEVST